MRNIFRQVNKTILSYQNIIFNSNTNTAVFSWEKLVIELDIKAWFNS